MRVRKNVRVLDYWLMTRIDIYTVAFMYHPESLVKVIFIKSFSFLMSLAWICRRNPFFTLLIAAWRTPGTLTPPFWVDFRVDFTRPWPLLSWLMRIINLKACLRTVFRYWFLWTISAPRRRSFTSNKYLRFRARPVSKLLLLVDVWCFLYKLGGLFSQFTCWINYVLGVGLRFVFTVVMDLLIMVMPFLIVPKPPVSFCMVVAIVSINAMSVSVMMYLMVLTMLFLIFFNCLKTWIERSVHPCRRVFGFLAFRKTWFKVSLVLVVIIGFLKCLLLMSRCILVFNRLALYWLWRIDALGIVCNKMVMFLAELVCKRFAECRFFRRWRLVPAMTTMITVTNMMAVVTLWAVGFFQWRAGFGWV